jgi:hypothetical protein
VTAVTFATAEYPAVVPAPAAVIFQLEGNVAVADVPMLSKFSVKVFVPVIGTCAFADITKIAGRIAAQSSARSLRRKEALVFMAISR